MSALRLESRAWGPGEVSVMLPDTMAFFSTDPSLVRITHVGWTHWPV